MPMPEEPEPLLEYIPEDEGPGGDDLGEDVDIDPDEQAQEASNDEWAYRKAERLVSRIPGRVGKDQRTEGDVFDRQTLLTLHKMLRDGVLRSLDFPVSTGKEANVFRGTVPTGGHVAVKIYRVNTSTFRHALKYIEGDERFEGATGDKRSMVGVWAQKEFRNLDRMREAGASVPEPIRVAQNVLVMEYIGLPEGPWPLLKQLGRLDDPQRFWEALRDDYLKIVNEAGLVHADFSEFNVLVEHADDPASARVRVIDAGQAVLRNHPMAREFLERDVKNITSYFARQGLKVTPADILDDITAVLD